MQNSMYCMISMFQELYNCQGIIEKRSLRTVIHASKQENILVEYCYSSVNNGSPYHKSLTFYNNFVMFGLFFIMSLSSFHKPKNSRLLQMNKTPVLKQNLNTFMSRYD